MPKHVKQLLLLLGALIVANMFLPPAEDHKLAGGIETISPPATVTYQRGDGKGAASETDDGTIASRYVEGTIVRPSEYQGDGDNPRLYLKRLKEVETGVEATIDTKRILIKFPNIIGDGSSQIPQGSTIHSAYVKLTVASVTGPQNIKANVYRVLQRWDETEPGFLRVPSWRQYQQSAAENENLWTDPGADTPTSSAPEPVISEVLMPRTGGSVVALDITTAVAAWAKGEANHGVMIKLFEETAAHPAREVAFYSSEWNKAAMRPLLEVKYALKGAAEKVTPPPAPPPPPPSPTPVPIKETLPQPVPTPPSPLPLPPTPTPAPTPKAPPAARLPAKQIPIPAPQQPLPIPLPPQAPPEIPKTSTVRPEEKERTGLLQLARRFFNKVLELIELLK